MYLVLTYFHAIRGPKIIFSFPDMVPEGIYKSIRSLFDVDSQNPFFEFVLAEENVKIINLYFEVPSKWARGEVEMCMLSLITDTDTDSKSFYDILKDASARIMVQSNIYKSLYVDQIYEEKDIEIKEKYEELKRILSELHNDFLEKKKELTLMELVSSRTLSLSGAYNVFEDILIDIISGILQQKQFLFIGDKDASTALYSILNRIFLDILPLENYMKIKNEPEESDKDSFILNTRLRIIESGEVSKDAHPSINKILQESLKTGDKEAAIILIRQKLSILLKAAELLEKILKKPTVSRSILKDIQKYLKIKLKVEDLNAIRLILKAKNQEEIANRIVVSKFDSF